MNYFLIDYENVNVSGFDGIASLTDNDALIIFYSNNANTLTFGLHMQLNETRANLQYQKVDSGKKNSLDFQLCSYLGYLICDTMCKPGENSKNFYYIVSNDLGYVPLTDYWKKRGIEVLVVKNLTKTPSQTSAVVVCSPPPKPQPAKTSEVVVFSPPPQPKVPAPVATKSPTSQPANELERAIAKILSNKQDIAEAVKIIKSAKTKVNVNNNLGKKFGTQTGGKIYQAVKTFIANKS